MLRQILNSLKNNMTQMNMGMGMGPNMFGNQFNPRINNNMGYNNFGGMNMPYGGSNLMGVNPMMTQGMMGGMGMPFPMNPTMQMNNFRPNNIMPGNPLAGTRGLGGSTINPSAPLNPDQNLLQNFNPRPNQNSVNPVSLFSLISDAKVAAKAQVYDLNYIQNNLSEFKSLGVE